MGIQRRLALERRRVQPGPGLNQAALQAASRTQKQALAEYLTAKWTPDAIGSDRRASDPADILVTEILALYAMEKAPRVADPVSCQGPVAAERILGRHDAPVSSAIRRSLARGRRRPHSR
ncbi:hypothetical protein D3C77_305770 [compost metagenome]